MIHQLTKPTLSVRALALATGISLVVVQLALPDIAEASHLGSSTASAGSAPPPAATLVQNFQPDLFTGRATTGVPILVPPGRKGVQPSLALSYASSSRNGWLGVGWSLDAGYIERSTKNGVPKYDSSDTYTFMFQGVASDLVSIGGNEYRAKDEGLFLKFLNNGVSGWEVWDKSGTHYFFGQTVSSQIESTGQTFRWALDKVIDPNGNYLTITYTKDQTQLYLSRIDYTGHQPTSLTPSNYVEFIIEDRPDDEVSYRSGFAVTTAKRLKEIRTYATVNGQPNQLARKYVLSYTTSGRTGRSIINSAQQFGTDGTTSLPATNLTYQDSGSATYPNILSNIVPPPSVAGWNVRKANLDTGHETWGCAHPYSGLPWGSPIQTTGGFDLGCVSGSASGNGDITMSGCNDHFGHEWTYVYVPSPQTLSVSLTNGGDAVGCLRKQEAGGSVTQVTGGSISLQTGWSPIHITSYHQHQGWGPTTFSGGIKNQLDGWGGLMNPTQIPLGVPQLAGDVNGDAKTDLIKFTPSSGTWDVSCATSCTFPPSGSWLTGFGNSSSIPLLGDWNGDGWTDIAIYTSGSWQFASSAGANPPGFVTQGSWNLSFGSGDTPLTGDFNGDGKTDIGTYNNGSWSIALWNGNGFSSSGGFSLSWGDSGYEALTGDFNGDGLTDIGIVNESTGSIDVRLSTGSAWAGSTNWIGSFGGSNPHTSADFNGDGLTDAVYYNRSAGQVIYAPSTGSSFGSSVTLPLTFLLTSPQDNIQVGDFNGDSIADPAVFNIISGSSQLALSSLTNADGSNGTATDVLRTIQNGVGGTTTINYQPSTLCGCGQDPLLPFIVHVVQQAKQEDGLGNSYTTTYLFHGGLYDAPTKEFRGFEEATVFDVDGNKSFTKFHQDEHKKGRPFLTEFRDQYENLWAKTEQTWSCTEPYPGVHFAKLDQTDSYTYDGDTDFKQTRAHVQYDSYGNVSRIDEDGDVTVSGDERSAVTEFVYNAPAWIVNKPKLTQTLDNAQTVVAQRRFYYDGASSIETPPTTGRLTKLEEWLNLPTERWLGTTTTYDAYGNVATVTDALQHITTNTYDTATHTSLEVITNHLGHTRSQTYDPRLGQVLTTTDQNNVTATTIYDVLGRVSKLIGPTDTEALPTISYEYDVASVPNKTTTHSRIQSGQPSVLTAYTFTDGLGRSIQTRSPTEDPGKQVVTGSVEFNNRGLAVKQWTPYFSNFSTSYVPVTSEPGWETLAKVAYTHDPTRRPLSVIDPDGATTTTAYDDWAVTTTDAKGHQTQHTNDAYGRLIQIEEFNTSQVYTTTHQYDVLNNLTRTTDHQSHITQVSYDSLSRKLSMDEPDTGHSAYTYDDVDKLLTQTDARGVVTTLQYDALNRVTNKSSQIPPGADIINPGAVTYAYDDPQQSYTKGRLTSVTEAAASATFVYDNLGRMTGETKTISGTPRTISRTYDLLGRLLTLTYANGDIATYTYNSQAGLETVTLQPQGQPVQSIVTNMDYNAAGQITKVVYGNGVVSDYTLNPQTLRLDRLVTNGPGGTLQDFTYDFDPVGNVESVVDVVHTGSQTFGYDDLNRLTSASGSYGNHTYTYDPIGNITLKEGVTMTYGEGAAGPHAVTSTSDGWTMTYDANGNVIQKTPTVSSMISQIMRYDTENHLMEIKTAQEVTVELHFEPGHNFFSLPVMPDDASIAALFPAFAQDLEWIGHFNADYNDPYVGDFQFYVGHPTFDDFTALEYGKGYQLYCKNPNGFTVQITGKLPTSQYALNVLPEWHLLPAVVVDGPQPVSWLLQGVNYDQIKRWNPSTQQLETPNQVLPGESYFVHVVSTSLFNPPLPRDQTTTFIYDAEGGKAKRITAAGTTTYLGEHVEIAPDGTTTNYVFAGSLRVASWDATNGLQFYHKDHLGSSNVITNSTGQLVQLLEYSPYGSVIQNQGSVDVAHKFTGQRQDDVNGLVVFPGRVYDPQLGRFLQPDPFVQDPADPQMLNRYSYVRNNPLNLVDPSGYIAGWDDLIYWLIWAAIFAAEGAYLYNTWPYKEGFDPSILQDTGIRFLQPFTPPIIPPSITQQFSQAATSIAQGAQALSTQVIQLEAAAIQGLVEFGQSATVAAIQTAQMNVGALQAMASYAEPYMPSVQKNSWNAIASKGISMLSEVNRVTTQTILFAGASQSSAFAGVIETTKITQPFAIFKHATKALAVSLLAFDLNLTSQSSLPLGKKLLRGGIQTAATVGAIGAGILIGGALAAPAAATLPVIFGYTALAIGSAAGAGFVLDLLKEAAIKANNLNLQ